MASPHDVILLGILGILTLITSTVFAYGIRVPGMDLTPIGTIMVAHAGGNPLLAAVVLSIAYKLPKPQRLIWIWVQVPVAYLTGWLAATFNAVLWPIIVYYVLSLGFGIVSGTIGGRYYLSVAVGLCLNLVIGRIYTFTL